MEHGFFLDYFSLIFWNGLTLDKQRDISWPLVCSSVFNGVTNDSTICSNSAFADKFCRAGCLLVTLTKKIIQMLFSWCTRRFVPIYNIITKYSCHFCSCLVIFLSNAGALPKVFMLAHKVMEFEFQTSDNLLLVYANSLQNLGLTLLQVNSSFYSHMIPFQCYIEKSYDLGRFTIL